MSVIEAWKDAAWVLQAELILNSYRHWFGEDLIERGVHALDTAERLFNANRVVVSHDTSEDPLLNYASRVALQLWEMTPAQLITTPSRETAEPVHRDERAELLRRTTEHGYVDDYQGIRISSSGRRFRIDQAIVWNLVNDSGDYAGQAATFTEWEWLDAAE